MAQSCLDATVNEDDTGECLDRNGSQSDMPCATFIGLNGWLNSNPNKTRENMLNCFKTCIYDPDGGVTQKSGVDSLLSQLAATLTETLNHLCVSM